MENKRKGFTLVELLAVIVILAIIMIIAIPSVLGTMTIARKKSFVEYVTKVYMAAQNKYMSAQTLGQSDLGSSFTGYNGETTLYYYNIKTDLGLENVGDYKGYVGVIKPTTNSPKPTILIMISDSNYALVDRYEDIDIPVPYYTYIEEPNPDTNIIDVDDTYNGFVSLFESKINMTTKTIDLEALEKDVKELMKG